MKEITIRITGARYADGELHLACSPAEGIRAVHGLERDKKYDLVRHREKRSLTANAYAWALINKISEKIHEPPQVVYRRYIRDIGGKRSVVIVPVEDVQLECETFVAGHIGRLVSVGNHALEGIEVHKIYGSSSFNRKQMAAFIDQIVQDAQALGIETKDPGYIESLIGKWEEKPNGNA